MIRNNGGNNMLVLIILIGLLIAFGVYCVWGKGDNKPEEYTKSAKINNSKDNIEMIQPADSDILEEYNEGPPKNNTELLDPGDGDFDEIDDGLVSYL